MGYIINKQNKFIFLLISLIVFIISLTQNAITYNDFDGKKIYSSFSLFFMGCLAILGGGLLEWLIWIANPLYFLAIIFFYKSHKLSIIFSTSAMIIALSFTTWKEILVSESGRTAKIENLNLGYWLWILSLLILTSGVFLKKYKNDN